MIFGSLFDASVNQKKKKESTNEEQQQQQPSASSNEKKVKNNKKKKNKKRKRNNNQNNCNNVIIDSNSKNDEGSNNNNKINSQNRHNQQQKQQQQQQQQQRPYKRRKKDPVSAEAMELSNQLKELSRQKKVKEALELYWNSSIRDEYHACIVVDCCSRCGNVLDAEKIIHKLEEKDNNNNNNHYNKPLNIETQTALLKGYVHSGKMYSAIKLFEKIIKQQCQPNVRTLNTFLRGCLWTATTTNDNDEQLVGGIVAAEKALRLYCESATSNVTSNVISNATSNNNNINNTTLIVLDTSSYEYYIILLCQALRTDEAEEKINEFLLFANITIKGKASISGGDQTTLETLAVIYLSLSRSYALLEQSDLLWQSAQRSLSAIQLSRKFMTDNDNNNNEESKSKKKRQSPSGGKRGWKTHESKSGGHDNNNKSIAQRDFSNVAYRSHRLSEIESEVRSLLKCRNKNSKNEREKSTSEDILAERIQRHLIYFSGGGTTELLTNKKTSNNTNSKASLSSKDKQKENQSHLVSAWHSFGLQQLCLRKADTTTADTQGKTLKKPSKIVKVLKRFELSHPSVLNEDGYLNLENIFKNEKLPLDIELGAGFGSWIVQQANDNPKRNYLAVELRADRVYQIFARTCLNNNNPPLSNVCVIGAECGQLLNSHIQKETISTIFVNHPEPPTQTYGGYNNNNNILEQIVNGTIDEPAHMLNSITICSMATCLKKYGKIIIVTDNRLYSRMIAATFAKVMMKKQCNNNLLRSYTMKDIIIKNDNNISDNLRQIESLFNNNITIFQGQPNELIGHSKNHNSSSSSGTSYFDRLWRTGAGTSKAIERNTRFILIMERQ